MQLFSERRLATMDRAVASGRVLPYLAVTTLVATVLAGLAVEIPRRP